jgi:hypothetical protein
MKSTSRLMLSLFVLFATFAVCQNNNIPQVQHVIVVIQENRTPTNLFHEDAPLVSNGAHVIPPNNQGPCGTCSLAPKRNDVHWRTTRARHPDRSSAGRSLRP